MSNITPIILPLFSLGIVYFFCLGVLLLTQDKEEPPLALHSIPFLEPLIQLLIRKYKIWIYLSSLVLAVDRSFQTLSFAPIEASATATTLGTTEATNEIMRRDPAGSNGHFTTFHRAVRPHLSPGWGLDGMVERALCVVGTCLSNTHNTSPQKVNFFGWVRHMVLLATTEGEYGPGNPFRELAFEQAWFKFLPGVPIMAGGFFPYLFARQSSYAREYLAQGFERYFRDGHHLNGCAALLARMEHGVAAGLPASDRARGEIGYSMALVNNTVPAAFWLLHHVYRDAALLEECRRELSKAVQFEEDGTRTIHLAHVQSSCPTLNSTLHEVFRYYGIGTVLLRQVVQSHKLNNTYLLKKGSFVLMPNITQHYSPKVWGSDANHFNPRRFCFIKRRNPAGMRVFGGGAILCPGRHFAENVILAFAAQMLLRFDVQPANGVWSPMVMEETLGLGVAKVFLLPACDPEVEVAARAPNEHVWRVRLPKG
ncbi:cytochrome P450 oxidoreductase [Metarhizium acridum CQMa 102]|uniref:Cytochrome P450 oxidoreductase n=1 Tax=Metarhizium acridum (strain CQMa 102) TaxID=655827 RepID=E9EFR1_METAQ|nr:cytochrome P450 oxidoreductase [Metarhizium acridum CQMa 102]EFY85249.1 cytochrome P450 oxidoreductase [Metarhizium acridum CQMa 102]